MSQESALALPCPGCDMNIFWLQYHVPHCKNTNNSTVINRLKAGKVVARD